MKDVKKYESMSVQEKWSVLAMISDLYYNAEMSQNEIADRLYISRSKVSRMLKEARESGVVEIFIHEPWERNLGFEKTLQEKFGLKRVRVIKLKDSEINNGLIKLAECAAYYLNSIVKQKTVVGISWGNTLYEIVKYLKTTTNKNIPITVVPIMGAANTRHPERDAMDLAKDVATVYGGKYQYIYAPLFVKNKELKENLIGEENIKIVLDTAKNADIILTSVGSIAYKTWSNYLSPDILSAIGDRGAVGHIGGHFFDRNGMEINTSLIDCMVGISLDDIKNCKETICAAFGDKKSEALLGALRGNFINTLLIDESCAERVIELM